MGGSSGDSGFEGSVSLVVSSLISSIFVLLSIARIAWARGMSCSRIVVDSSEGCTFRALELIQFV